MQADSETVAIVKQDVASKYKVFMGKKKYNTIGGLFYQKKK